MTTKPMKQIAIRLPDEIIEALDQIVDERHGMADRTQVLREVLMEGLIARGKVKR